MIVNVLTGPGLSDDYLLRWLRAEVRIAYNLANITMDAALRLPGSVMLDWSFAGVRRR